MPTFGYFSLLLQFFNRACMNNSESLRCSISITLYQKNSTHNQSFCFLLHYFFYFIVTSQSSLPLFHMSLSLSCRYFYGLLFSSFFGILFKFELWKAGSIFVSFVYFQALFVFFVFKNCTLILNAVDFSYSEVGILNGLNKIINRANNSY